MNSPEKYAWWEETHRRLVSAIQFYLAEHPEVQAIDEPTALQLLVFCREKFEPHPARCGHCGDLIGDPDIHQCSKG